MPAKKTAKSAAPKATKTKTPRAPKKSKVVPVQDDQGMTAESHPGEFPSDHVMKLTELEALRFGSLDTTIRNALQGMKILEQEGILQDIQHQKNQENRHLQRLQLQSQVAGKEAEYKNLVNELAEKYRLEPDKMSIDPDTRVIRDLREEKPA
jgi:hypothetical protein